MLNNKNINLDETWLNAYNFMSELDGFMEVREDLPAQEREQEREEVLDFATIKLFENKSKTFIVHGAE